MGRGLLVRLFRSIVTISFLLLHLIPGDPVDFIMGEQAAVENRQAMQHELGLDQPLSVQYLTFMKKLVKGDLGESYLTHEKVSIDLLRHSGPRCGESDGVHGAFNSMRE